MSGCIRATTLALDVSRCVSSLPRCWHRRKATAALDARRDNIFAGYIGLNQRLLYAIKISAERGQRLASYDELLKCDVDNGVDELALNVSQAVCSVQPQ